MAISRERERVILDSWKVSIIVGDQEARKRKA
jgi:hypothetical protein